MGVKEKLVELIQNAVGGCARNWAEVIADGLIAHGVCLDSKQETELPKDFGRWIPVEERKPDTVFCEATGKRYSEAVNVLTSGRKVITAIYDGEDFVGDAEFWWVEDGEVITHWTPVLLPLPQPTKGGMIMKCTECPEYNECSKKYNLTIRRRRCPRAKEEKVVTEADRIRAMSDEELAEGK